MSLNEQEAGSPSALASIPWTDEQRRVIEAPESARIIVDAGPGTGKTAVACARLAYLITEDLIAANRAWLISYTRTAIAEIRSRLQDYIGDEAASVKIVTIDSYAWRLHSGYTSNAKLTGSYEQNISAALRLINGNDADINDDIGQIQHLIIDEAQDTVGDRAKLLERLVEKLNTYCGVTVFSDEAQAIYGFADDESRGRRTRLRPDSTLISKLSKNEDLGFTSDSLTNIHRTDSVDLRKIFSDTRKKVLNTAIDSKGIYQDVSDEIHRHSPPPTENLNIADHNGETLILFRSRAEALYASQFSNEPYRLRLSGYGPTLPAWIAQCFWDFTEPYMAKEMFALRWAERVILASAPEISYGVDEAWMLLLGLAGTRAGSLDMKMLRTELSRVPLPSEIVISEFGFDGPTVGTIHASKGREASNVILATPRPPSFDSIEQEKEEARVLFVGATRAKTSLQLTTGVSLFPVPSHLPSGRAFRRSYNPQKGGDRLTIEIGRDGDLCSTGLVGRTTFSSESEALKSQMYLSENSHSSMCFTLKLTQLNEEWFHTILNEEGDTTLGHMSKTVNAEIWAALYTSRKDKTNRPPSFINYVRAQGCTTLVVNPDDPIVHDLHEPWKSSGFMLKPRIAAFPTFTPPRRK